MSGETNTSGTTKILSFAFVIGLVAVGVAFFVSNGGVPAVAMLAALPIAIVFAGICIANPRRGLFMYLHTSFFINGFFRFFNPLTPYGLAVDLILLICLLGTLFNAKREDLKRLNNPIFWVSMIWLMYTVFQAANPEARSKEAWFYAVRGVSFYWAQTIFMGLIWLTRKQDMEKMIRIWLAWSFLAALWGFKQQYVGLAYGEMMWLEGGAKLTHVLMGKLRSFSFYSDAGQFGAAMAHACIVSLILAMGNKLFWRKVTYGALAMVYFWGFAVAGSRGPLFVIAAGFLMYLFMIKNFRILAVGLIAAALAFIVLKYTFIGQGNYQIQRMRSALDPKDPSLMVRLDNQKKLRAYLATRPLGGGIGSGGGWGQRFTPGSFLAETALDSWYVKIWVESGIVGLYYHIFMLLVILYVSFKKVFFLEDPELRTRCIALLSGFFGILVASYGNQVLGQLPTSTVMFLSMVFFQLCDIWDTENPENEVKQPKTEPNLLW